MAALMANKFHPFPTLRTWEQALSVRYHIAIGVKRGDQDAAQNLEEQVNKLLADGWALHGGVAIDIGPRDGAVEVIYAQAMTKEMVNKIPG
jgi:hypothetical protein